MTQPLQSVLQAEIRKLTGKTTQDFNGDLHDLCSYYNIPMAPISGRAIGLAKIFRSDISTASAALNYLQANATQVVGPGGLFANGEQGAWYDPSDSTTLFSDPAGTTPVAQPGAGAQVVVGLMLDKSQNGVGTNGAKRVNLLNYTEQFDNAVWTKFADTVAANVLANPLTGAINADSLTEQALTQVHGVQQPAVTVTAATSYTASIYVRQNGRSVIQICFDGGHVSGNPRANYDIANGVLGSVDAGITASITSAGNDWYRCVATVTTATTSLQPVFLMVTSTTAARAQSYLGDITKGIYIWGADLRLASEASTAPTYQPITSSWYATEAGNHAISYNSTTARPELSARVNLLTYSEQFDNAAWVKFQSTVSANTTATTDPLGGNTADKLIPNNASTIPFAYNSVVPSVVGVQYTASVYAKAAELGFVFVVNNTRASSTQAGVCVNLSTGATSNAGANGTYVVSDVGNGWWRISATTTATSGSGYLEIWPMAVAGTGGYAGNGTSGIYIWGADLRPANIGANVPAYQRIADQYTYDNSASFPRYLRFDGVDDGMSTPANLNLTSTDKATVFAGVRRAVASPYPIICEFSADWNTNNYCFFFGGDDTPLNRWFMGLKGTSVGYYSPQTYTPPISNVLTAQYNLAGANLAAQIVPRVNGIVEQENPVGSSGTPANFGTYPLFIGSRNNSAFWFNGNIYSLIVRGAATDASTISATETWVAGKTGITI